MATARRILFIISLLLAALVVWAGYHRLQRRQLPERSLTNEQTVLKLIEGVKTRRRGVSTWEFVGNDAVRTAIEQSGLNREDLFDGLRAALANPIQENREDAIQFLVRMKDAEADAMVFALPAASNKEKVLRLIEIVKKHDEIGLWPDPWNSSPNYVTSTEVENAIQRSGFAHQDLLAGLRDLLMNEKSGHAVQFLVRLRQHDDARALLLEAVESNNVGIATLTIRGLNYALSHEDPTIRAALRRIVCDDEKDFDLRLAAAHAHGFDLPEAVDVLKVGLLRGSVRIECERTLELLGKLELPLPDEVYSTITQSELDYVKKTQPGSMQRMVEKNGFLYFEWRSPGDAVIFEFRRWYQLRLAPVERD